MSGHVFTEISYRLACYTDIVERHCGILSLTNQKYIFCEGVFGNYFFDLFLVLESEISFVNQAFGFFSL